MARGTPDYGNPVNQQAVKTIDPGEITRAILNTDTLDGKGRLFWYDDFHSNLAAWSLSQQAPGTVPAISPAVAEIPPSCVNLFSGNVAGETSTMARNYFLGQPARCGFECSIYLGNNIPVFQMNVGYNTGTLFYNSSIAIPNPAVNEQIAVYTPSGYYNIVIVATTGGQSQWLPIKYVIDLTTGYYVRAVIGQNTYDLSGQQINSSASGNPAGQMNMSLNTLYSSVGQSINVGHFIMTIDEP